MAGVSKKIALCKTTKNHIVFLEAVTNFYKKTLDLFFEILYNYVVSIFYQGE